jgi:hypothetical protein
VVILKVARTLRRLVRRFPCLLGDSFRSEAVSVRVGFSSNLMNGRRHQMLRSGGIPAWLQLLGAPGNRECANAKAFGRIRLASRGQRRRGGQMLGAPKISNEE